EGGTLSIVAKEGDTLAVGETIARIGEGGGSEDSDADSAEATAGDDGDDADSDEDDDAAAAGDEAEAGDDEDDSDEDGAKAEAGDESAGAKARADGVDSGGAKAGDAGSGNGRVKASPIARRMARDMGLELASLQGSGPGGRIVKADVEAAAKGGVKAEAEPAEKAEPKRAPDSGRGDIAHEELTRLQRTVARRMAESKATAPDFVMTVEVDMEDAVALRAQLKAAAGDAPAPSFNDFVV